MINVYTLKNGLRVALENVASVRSVSFGIWVLGGSRYENEATNGLYHFIEHMLFKGTKKRSAKDIADEMDAVGGQINAFTSKECTCFYTRTLDNHFDIALDVLTDMFFNSKFAASDITKERNVILEEINMGEDTPEDLVHDILQRGVWADDPLGMKVTGTPESIKHFKQKDFKDFIKSRYLPQNTVIAVAGNIDEDEMLSKITAAFEGFAVRDNYEQPVYKAVYAPSFSSCEKDIEQTHMCVGFPGIPAGSDDIYTVAAINTIFGGGMSSRLFQKIREEHGLAYAVYSYHAAFAETGLFTVYSAQNPAQTPDVLQMITDEIKQMFTNKVTPEQLDKTREQLKSNFLLGLESTSNRMNSIGRSLLLLDKTFEADEIVKKIDAVTIDKFYELCEKIMKPDQMSVALVGRLADLKNCAG